MCERERKIEDNRQGDRKKEGGRERENREGDRKKESVRERARERVRGK